MDCYSLTEYGGTLVFKHTNTPSPCKTEVLIEILGCGICHSDLHIREGYFNLGSGKKLDLSKLHKLPLTLGHEIVGRVVGIGDSSGDIKFGDTVVVFPWMGCGRCDLCVQGTEHLCSSPRNLGINVDGGFATHIIVSDEKYLFPITNIDPKLAATYACSGLTAYSALKKIREKAHGTHLLIIGAGGVGLAGIKIAKATIDTKLVVAEIDSRKREAAEAAGADFVINPNEPNSRKLLKDISQEGMTAAVDFVGSEQSVKFGIQALGKMGSLVIVGLFGGSIAMSIPIFPLKSISVLGSYVGSLSEMAELMELVNNGNIEAIPITTRPLSDANDCLEELAKGEIVGRTVLQP